MNEHTTPPADDRWECPRCHQWVTSDSHKRYNNKSQLVDCV